MANEERLISANKLRQMLNDTINKMYILRIDGVGGVLWFIDQIDNAPTVDAVKVVHGRWELYPSSMHRRCSVCKMEYEKPKFNIRANYCPNCGAKMEG